MEQKGSGSFCFQMVPMLKWNSSLLNFVFDGNKISFYHSSNINVTYFCFTIHWSDRFFSYIFSLHIGVALPCSYYKLNCLMAILEQKGSGSFCFQMMPMLKWNSSLLNFVFDGNKISFYHSSNINVTYFCVSLYIGVIGSFRIFFHCTLEWLRPVPTTTNCLMAILEQ